MLLNVLQNYHSWKNCKGCKCLANSNIGIFSFHERIMICLNNTNQLSSRWSSKCGSCLLCSLLGLRHLEVHWGVILFVFFCLCVCCSLCVLFLFFLMEIESQPVLNILYRKKNIQLRQNNKFPMTSRTHLREPIKNVLAEFVR